MNFLGEFFHTNITRGVPQGSDVGPLLVDIHRHTHLPNVSVIAALYTLALI